MSRADAGVVVLDWWSRQAANRCRLIDCVSVKGSKQPMKLYTFDIGRIPVHLGCYCKDANHYMDADFATDPAIAQLQADLPSELEPRFSRAMTAYQAGDWSTARTTFESVLEVMPNDGPTKTLLDFMRQSDFIAPVDWNGVRELIEK